MQIKNFFFFLNPDWGDLYNIASGSVKDLSAARAVQRFSDPPKLTGSDRPESQRVNPKPVVSRIRVCFFQNPIIRVG